MARRKARTSSHHTSIEGLGAAFGRVAARLDAWKKQRSEIVAEIHHLAASAQTMLGELGETTTEAIGRIRQSRGGRPKGYKTSEATKRKLRAAWKRRKAREAASSSGKPSA